ncbi:sigma-70 family RNA polymerase sigma factor [Rhodopirellula europaea]|uniref:sigma-70 family RNA polymerase sigma factor n=1 Tax=Rhodopirellula europaea TaxID=1263866 RepID=UPI003D2C88E5
MSDWEAEKQWEDLRTNFINATHRSFGWLEVWNIFVSSDLYRNQLSTCAEISLMETGAPKSWADDVAHDAMLLLARQLRKRSDLGYQFDRPPKQFASWFRTILFHQCHEAIRSFRRRHGRDSPLELDPISERSQLIEQRLDIRMAVDRLDEPMRTILMLGYGGLSLREIADRLQLTYDQVRYANKQGRETLERKLKSGYQLE